MIDKEEMLTEAQKEEYCEMAAEDLVRSLDTLIILEKWYEEIGENLPLPSRTNFRDAWFHYKKLYEHRTYKNAIQEQYAAEEHLIRAVKDAVIQYFHIYMKSMEKVYRRVRDGSCLKDEERKREWKLLDSQYHFPKKGCKGWESDLYNILHLAGKEESYGDALWYVFLRDGDMKKVEKVLQRALHKVKNYCAQLRIGGTDIYRPSDEYEMEKNLLENYKSLISSLESIHMKIALWFMDEE